MTEKAIAMLEEQQAKVQPRSPQWMVGEQLKDICRREPHSAELIAQDLENPAMSITEADGENDGTTIVPLPNDPLTLEELQKMGGEPVWISPAVAGGKVPERWMLISDFLPENGVLLFMPPSGLTQGYRASTYGKKWLAYRRRPEKGAAEK